MTGDLLAPRVPEKYEMNEICMNLCVRQTLWGQLSGWLADSFNAADQMERRSDPPQNA